MTPDGVQSVFTPTEGDMVPRKTQPDLVGLKEIAEMAGVNGERGGTVYVWRSRGVLPEAEWTISGNPVWQRETIRKWLEDTGRVKKDEPAP